MGQTYKTRASATETDLGGVRYNRYVLAFDRIESCIASRHALEAIAILDSLIGDRLASRAGFLSGAAQSERRTCGQLCVTLVGKAGTTGNGVEVDEELRKIATEIQDWVNSRNAAMHGTAKLFQSEDRNVTFESLLGQAYEDACRGRELLRNFDQAETKLRQDAGKNPASWPNAFFPERTPRGRPTSRSS